MATTTYLALSLYDYTQDTSGTEEAPAQTNTLTYQIGSVASPSTIPSAAAIVAGAPDTVPDTEDGQHLEFNRDGFTPETSIPAVITLGQVGTQIDLFSAAVQNLVFNFPNSSPYQGQVSIWDTSGSGDATKWGSLTLANGTTTVIENTDAGIPTVGLYSGNSRVLDGDFIETPTGPLPVSFAIELLNGDGAVDYVPLSIVNNCLPEDALIEKMVEAEE